MMVWKVKHVALGDVAAPEGVFLDEAPALESLRRLKGEGRPAWLYVNEVPEGTPESDIPSGTNPSDGWSKLA